MKEDLNRVIDEAYSDIKRHGSGIPLENMTLDACTDLYLNILKMKITLQRYMELRFPNE